MQITRKEEILEKSINLFKNKSYHNTSMSNIASECDLIKGSLYHHFKSKEEIGLESLKYVHKYFNDNIFSIAYNTKLTTKERMTLFIQKLDEYFIENKSKCLFGHFSLELASENDKFKQEIKDYFLSWEKALVFILNEEYEEKTSVSYAQECIALTQGSLMMMGLYDSNENYLKIGKKLIKLF
ncbi:MAG: TetR/AcrR family transcriptional regulator [Campylobacteraceae bacterium]|nr:TetR/AcrR family transcriptional regulator [Campylobacteraceae bacterium]